jgi:hypothetical protein
MLQIVIQIFEQNYSSNIYFIHNNDFIIFAIHNKIDYILPRGKGIG